MPLKSNRLSLFLTNLAGCMMLAGVGAAEPMPQGQLVLPPLDNVELATKAAAAWKPGLPKQFAEARSVSLIAAKTDGAAWEKAPDGRLVWRHAVTSKGADTLNFGFGRFFLPHGAELRIISPATGESRGPYTDAQNKKHRQFWTPVLQGDAAIIEVTLPADMLPFLELELTSVNHGFADPLKGAAPAKSGSCNVDVVCSEGDAWRDQIRSVGAYTVRGVDTCTGTLLNNETGDNTPYFLTADHCEVREGDAASVVVYWNYESPECREPGSVESGNPINRNLFDETSSGTEFIATNAATDFTLLQLSEAPPLSYNVFFSGWDRSGTTPDSVVGIHHPGVEEKRISFENDALTITGRGEAVGGGDGYFRVEDWDVGTTEGGSSGSGIWDANRRLVGQLFGGFAACGNDEADWYGRLGISWDRGTTPGTRLRDWLDPNNTGVEFVDGKNACDTPTVTISSDTNPATPGQTVTFTATASGGAGNYTFAWDLNGDGSTDQEGQEVETHYPGAFNDQVSVRVTDGEGCTIAVGMAQSVRAPVIELTNVAEPVEMCGDGDGVVEPGERFSLDLTFTNNGNVIARNARAALATAATSSDTYAVTDSDDASCRFDSLDISGSGQSLDFQPASDFDAKDDGAAVISLQGPGLPLYDTTVSEVSMASNGYLSLGLNDLGADFSSDCPLPATPDLGDSTAARIMPYHDDLIIENGFYQYFASCPRSADTGANGPCQVFQWDNAGFFTNSGSIGNFDVQAIIYSDTGDMAFQYTGDDLPSRDSSTVGLQETGAASALTYACGAEADGVLQLNKAVCVQAPAELNRTGVDLETPTLALGNLAVNASTTVTLEFSLKEGMPCRSEFGFDYLGSVFDGGFSDAVNRGFYLGQSGGNSGQCNSNASCPAPAGNTIAPKSGLMYNPARPGNGSDTQFLGESVSMLWYTADASHYPLWYQIGGSYRNNQLIAPIKAFQLNGLPFETNVNPSRVEIGEAVVHWLSPEQAVFVWTLNGKTWGENIEFFVTSSDPVDENATGQWFNASELGWGVAYNKQGETDVQTMYFYDEDGRPVWLLNPAEYVNGLGQMKAYRWVHCPACPWSQAQPVDAGTLIGTLSNDGTGDISVDINLPVPMQGQWQRTDLPIQKIQ